MKYLFLTLLVAVGLTSCNDDDAPAPVARIQRTAQTVTVTYARTASTIVNDTLLLNPRMDVYVLRPTAATSNGTSTYPNTASATLVTSITDFTNPQPITLPITNEVVADNPGSAVRVVFTTTNRPGRRSSSQRLTASVLINGVSRVTFNHQGTNFSRNASAINGVFTTISNTNVAGFSY